MFSRVDGYIPDKAIIERKATDLAKITDETTENIIREPSVKIEREIEEAAHPINVSQNWKNIPKYDHYEDILNYEDIIKPGDLLKGVDTLAPAPKAESNKWLPPDWNKN